MKRVLFVDDEPKVLEGLRSVLRRQRKHWEMSFASSGEAALQALASTPFDVIVSDMRMPGLDGAALMRAVQQRHPGVVRIVLSGQTDRDVCIRMVHVAHQFLAKPCDGRYLQEVIERTCKLQGLLERPVLRAAVGQIGQLPVNARVHARLTDLLENPASSLAEIATVLESDIGTAAKVLQVVNSAFFGLARRVGDIRAAVTSLGLELLRTIALSPDIQPEPGLAPLPACLDLEELQTHSFLTARIARRLLSDPGQAQEAYSAALLRDAGTLALLRVLPGELEETMNRGCQEGRSVTELEYELLGASHAEIGGYLLGIWGLPGSIVQAVAHHHRLPPACGVDVSWAVRVAGMLAEQACPPSWARAGSGGLDTAYLAGTGFAGQIATLRAIADEEAAASSRH